LPRSPPSAMLRWMSPLLEVHDLTITFPSAAGPVAAVEGVSFTVGEGEAVALVGESGSGKTLSALAVLRLLPDSAAVAGGCVLLRSRDVLRMDPPGLRSIRGKEAAMVFQEPLSALNPVLTIGFQIAEAVLAHERLSKSAARARAQELLGLVGLPDPGRRLGDYPHQFSGGMRQRAMIAMALACSPALLIADEPTTALDVTVQAQILDLLEDLRARLGMALMLITHDMGVVARSVSRVYVLYAGRVVEEARTAEIFNRPAHPYTRALLQSLPRMGRRSRRLPAIPGAVPAPGRWPPGCAFAPRCSFAQERCAAAVPTPVRRGEDHFARCVLSEEESPWLKA